MRMLIQLAFVEDGLLLLLLEPMQLLLFLIVQKHTIAHRRSVLAFLGHCYDTRSYSYVSYIGLNPLKWATNRFCPFRSRQGMGHFVMVDPINRALESKVSIMGALGA